MKGYTYVILLKFSNGKTAVVQANNVDDILDKARKEQEKYPDRVVVDMDVDTIWDSPRVVHGEA